MSTRTVAVDPANSARTGVFDPYTAAPVVSATCEQELHNGETYTAHAVNLAMGIGDKLIIAFKTPPGPTLIHMEFEWSSGGEANVQLREGAVWTTATGAVVPILARNRANVLPSKVLENFNQPAFTASDQVVTNPAVTGSGVVLYADYTFEPRNTAATGKGIEFILAPDQTYTITLTTAVASNAGQVELGWSEHISS